MPSLVAVLRGYVGTAVGGGTHEPQTAARIESLRLCACEPQEVRDAAARIAIGAHRRNIQEHAAIARLLSRTERAWRASPTQHDITIHGPVTLRRRAIEGQNHLRMIERPLLQGDAVVGEFEHE